MSQQRWTISIVQYAGSYLWLSKKSFKKQGEKSALERKVNKKYYKLHW